MAEQWHYARGDQQLGPVDFEQLQLMAGSGELSPTDLVWQEGMPEWVAASSIDGLTFAAAAPAPAATIQPRTDTASPPPIKSARQNESSGLPAVPSIIWSVLMLAASGLLFLAFITPWWSVSAFKPDKDADQDEKKEFVEAAQELIKTQSDNEDWYEDHISKSKMREYLKDALDQDEKKASVSLWGWSTGAGVMGFVFVFIIVPLALVPMFVKPLRPWEWIGRFVVAIPGLLLFIFFLLWFFGAPSKNVPPILYQGLIVGPYLMLLASLCLLAVGILGGILGVLEFAANLKAKKQLSVE